MTLIPQIFLGKQRQNFAICKRESSTILDKIPLLGASETAATLTACCAAAQNAETSPKQLSAKVALSDSQRPASPEGRFSKDYGALLAVVARLCTSCWTCMRIVHCPVCTRAAMLECAHRARYWAHETCLHSLCGFRGGEAVRSLCSDWLSDWSDTIDTERKFASARHAAMVMKTFLAPWYSSTDPR